MRKLWILLACAALSIGGLEAKHGSRDDRDRHESRDRGRWEDGRNDGRRYGQRARDDDRGWSRRDRRSRVLSSRYRYHDARDRNRYQRERAYRDRAYRGYSDNSYGYSNYGRYGRSGLPPGLARRNGDLPPGLERQLARNGHLPPGLERRMRPLPYSSYRRLPPVPYGARRRLYGDRVITYDPRTGRILDVIPNWRQYR